MKITMSIKEELNAISRLYDATLSNNGISAIEKDLLLEKLRGIYDRILELPDSSSKADEQVKSAVNVDRESDVIQHKQPEELIVDVDNTVEARNTEPEIKTGVSPTRAQKFSATQSDSLTGTLFDDPAETTSEKNNDARPVASVHEIIANNTEDKNVTEKITKTPVADLKKSIGINEKFSFINELYNGNLQEYNESINEFNNADSLEAALSIFANCAENLKWEKNNDACLALMKLLERRFS
jgi:hypothetical protein